MTTVIELTKSKAESKQLYDKSVPDKLNEGFVYRSDWAAQSSDPAKAKYDGHWAGQLGARQSFIMHLFNPEVDSWELITQTM